MCVTTTAPTVSKQSIMSFSQPVIFVDAAIIIPFPEEKAKILLANPIFLPTVKKKLNYFFLSPTLNLN